MEKITKREMFEALVNYAVSGVMAFAAEEGDVVVSTEALEAFAKNEIALLDAKAAKAKERAAVKRAEGDALTDAVREALTEEAATIADIAARIEGEDVTVGKVQFRLNQLAKNGEAIKGEITIPATEGSKARKVVSYAKA